MGSLAGRVGRNVLWNLLGQAAAGALGVVAVPVLVRGLGAEGYALYGLMGVVSGTLGLLSFGASNGTIRFLSDDLARGDARGARATLAASAALHIAAVGAAAAVVLGLRGGVGAWLAGGAGSAGAWVVGCGAAGAVFAASAAFGGSVLQGAQRFDLHNGQLLAQGAAMLGGAALMAWRGLGLGPIGAWFVCVQAAGAALAVGLARAALPVEARGLGPARSERTAAFASYCAPVFLAQLAWAATFQFDRVFIAAFLPLADLAHYLAPAGVLQKVWMLLSALCVAVLPVASELLARDEKARARSLMRHSGQAVLWVVLPPYAVLYALAPQFLTLWLGGPFSTAGTWPMRWLVIGYAANALGALPTTLAFGAGRSRDVGVFQAVQAGLCVALWALLVPRHGIAGAAAGFAAAQVLTVLPFCARMNRVIFGEGLPAFLEAVALRPGLAGAATALALWSLRNAAWAWTWPGLLGLSAGAAAAMAWLGYAMMGPEERAVFERLRGAARARLG